MCERRRMSRKYRCGQAVVTVCGTGGSTGFADARDDRPSGVTAAFQRVLPGRLPSRLTEISRFGVLISPEESGSAAMGMPAA
jgi:hypothetical protein